MSMRNDHFVETISEDRIKTIAEAWRKEARLSRSHGKFDIVAFVTNVLSKKFRKKGPLKIEFFERKSSKDPLAFVTYNPLTLHITKAIWKLAQQGHGRSRFIVAHEIGHVLLHDHTAQAFLGNPELQNKFALRENSAEWQADTFAAYFLLPDDVVRQFSSVDEIVELCDVNEELALERLNAVCEARNRKTRSSNSGDACTECGNFTLVHKGVFVECDMCGSTAGRS